MSDEDELVVKLFALATYAEKVNHWVDDKRLMDAAGVADAIHEGIDRIEELEAQLKAAVGEAEKYQRAFAAQSRKLQAVLHIDGVRATIAELTGGKDE